MAQEDSRVWLKIVESTGKVRVLPLLLGAPPWEAACPGPGLILVWPDSSLSGPVWAWLGKQVYSYRRQ